MNALIKIQCIIIFLFFSNIGNTAHIIGGDITYECINFNTSSNIFIIEITATFYRDNKGGGGAFDLDAVFGVHVGDGSNWDFLKTVGTPLKLREVIDIENPNPCLKVPENVGADRGLYVFTIELPVIESSYMISYQRCCRNSSITNIYNPGETGAAFAIEIAPEAQKTCNSSPKFKGFPPFVICSDNSFVFDHSAIDSEADSIVYSFCNPLSSGGLGGVTGGNPCDFVIPIPSLCIPPYDIVQYVPPYSYLKPIPGDPTLTIDSQTGIISGFPSVQGQFVVGVCAQEYRDNVVIGELRRDFQFNITKCDPVIYADLGIDINDNIQSFKISSCTGKQIYIPNKSIDEENIKEYRWEFDILGEKTIFKTKDLLLDLPKDGIYNGLLILNPDSQCSDSAFIEVTVFPEIEASFDMVYDSCNSEPVFFYGDSNFTSDSISTWDWNFNNSTEANERNTSYLFESSGIKQISLIVTDINECRDTLIKELDYYPSPELIVVNPSFFIGCAPATVFLDNITVPLDSNYSIIWDFGDGTIIDGNTISPSHVYKENGVYDIKLKIIAPNGCEVEKSYDSWIRIIDKPTSSFRFVPEEPTIFNNEVVFQNLSIGGESYFWHFGDFEVSFEKNPIIVFSDTGYHEISLIVKNENNCTDTSIVLLNLVWPRIIHFPNAFSPNDDALNDIFKPKGNFDIFEDYELFVFNRWGELIFESKDPYYGWNGQRFNNGLKAQIGVYVYLAKFKDEYNQQKMVNGTVNLIR